MKRLGYVILASLMLVTAILTTHVVTVQGVTGRLDAGTADIVAGGVIRLPATGNWRFLRDGSHVTIGFVGEPKCLSTGALVLTYQKLKNVAFVSTDADESMARKGITTGASVNLTQMTLLFTMYTKDGPKRVNCGNPALRGNVLNFWVGAFGQLPE